MTEELLGSSTQDYQKKLDSLTKVNLMLDRRARAGANNELGLSKEEAYDVDTFILSNVKKTFLSIQTALNYHSLESDPRHPLERSDK
jgi:hypothetical protein